MSDINEMAKVPYEMTIGGNKYKVRRPSLKKVLAELEAELVTRMRQEIIDDAEALGLTGQDRVSFACRRRKDQFADGSLQDLVWNQISSTNGFPLVLYHALKKDQPGITIEDAQVIAFSDIEAASDWVTFLCGLEKNPPRAEAEKEQKAEQKQEEEKANQ